MNRDRDTGVWPELKRKPKPQFVSDDLSYIKIKPYGLAQYAQNSVAVKPQKKQLKDLFEIKSAYSFKKLNLL